MSNMDDRRQSLRPSGIPRFSRLPVVDKPATPASIRPSPSRESLTATAASDLRNPKLRATPSRDRLQRKESTNNLSSATPPARSLAQPSPRPRVLSAQASNPAQPTRTPRQAAGAPSKRASTLRLRRSELFTPLSASVDDPGENGEYGSENGGQEGGNAADTVRVKPYKPRPSLSERTIETLSQIPSSPALKGKSSAFFEPDGGNRPPSRPGSRPSSSYQSDSSNRASSRPHSRPGSSSGQDEGGINFRASTNTFKAPLAPIDGTPVRGRVLRTAKTPASRAVTAGSMARSVSSKIPQTEPFARSRTPSPEKRPFEGVPAPKYGSKTIAARPSKPRPALNGLFKKPSAPELAKAAATPTTTRKSSLASHRSSTSWEETNPSNASTASTALTVDSSESAAAASTSRKSSAALREQIAKAKAARRAVSRQISEADPGGNDEVPVIPTDTSFDFGLAADPFGQHRDDEARDKIIQARIQGARTSGRLNIAALGLRDIPAEVANMYEMESIGKYDSTWAESVDLSRFVAADNEIEMIEEALFPDVEPNEVTDDEDGRGNIFGGLETLDLHGNMLISLPMGLRRLQMLTSLNLSQNRITNNALEVISQITSLRDLKLGGNLFYGPLDPCFAKLENLEIADLHGNNISALPLNLANMSKLRILNISENNFESLVFEPLSKLPLTELMARKNKLSGVLIEDAVESLPSLQVLDVSSNQITHVVSPARKESLGMPALHQLCVSINRLQELPSLASWDSLLTLSADENNINSIPDGFTELPKLRHVDLSSNDIRVIPPEIAHMENLAMLRLSGNPLRDKKFCTATTDELKATLATRLEPVKVKHGGAATADDGSPTGGARAPAGPEDSHSDSRSDEDFATPPTSPSRSRSHTLSSSTWLVKSGGVLDRSGTESSSLHPVVCSRVAAEHTVREILLQRNLFTAFPDSLSFFADSLTSLSLAHNQLVGESYLGGAANSEELVLPSLKELNLSSNHITGLGPLIACLRAPALQKLDISFNRIATLPPDGQLKTAFPSLAVLLVSNNHLADLDPDAIRGLRIVDAMNNDIDHLNPRLGLLGGNGGLERLEVTGNRFRVPRFNIIERGTEATLRWLRGRVPVAEIGAWRESNNQRGEVDDVD